MFRQRFLKRPIATSTSGFFPCLPGRTGIDFGGDAINQPVPGQTYKTMRLCA